MRKLLSLLLTIILINCLSACYAGSITKLTYDGQEHDYDVKDITLMLNNDEFKPSEGQMPPIILDNRTLVPVREVFEYLGGKVDWEGAQRRVDVTFDDKKISLWIDNKEATVNEQKISLDVPAKIINDKTMVPARFISEQAGLQVGWNQDTYTVDIKFQPCNITNVHFANVNGTNCIVLVADGKITGYKYFSLPKDEENDLRLVIDVENCNFKFDLNEVKYPETVISAVRTGNQGNGVNRFVVALKEDTDYVVALSEDRKMLFYAMAEEFTPPSTNDNSSNNDETKTDEKTPTEVEVPETLAPQVVSGETKSSGEVKTTPEPKPSGEEKPSGDAKQIEVSKPSGEEKPIAVDKPSGEEIIEVKDNSGENIIIDNENPNSLDDVTPLAEHNYEESEEDEPEYDVVINSIKYSTTAERVKIKYTGKIKYDDMVLTNPNRVVIDIANAKLDTSGPTEINLKNPLISSIRFSQYTKGSVRIVIDLNVKCEYNIYKRSSELQVAVKETTYKNIKYKKNSSNSQITLQKADITKLSFNQEANKFKYTIKYNNNFDFGEGSFSPEDDLVTSVSIEDKIITIIDTGSCKYAVRQSNDNVIITIRKDMAKPEDTTPKVVESGEESGDEENQVDKKIILIDVGHGGSDPGACNGDEQEKVYNLKIALNLYDLLKEREDVEVYIDRKDNNTYLNREDRVAYATRVNPDFIISIHNNSLENKSYSGTMVLYFNNDTESDFGDVTSKEAAEIVVKELVSKLNTINRGVVNRGDLHILSKTPCPSILCEVCFISNDEELERLKTKKFQQDAAQAMYDGIDKILEAM